MFKNKAMNKSDTLAVTIEQELREYFAIPERIEMKWAVILEVPSDCERIRPAMLVGGDNLALDICQRRFCTKAKVLGASRQVYEANEVICMDDEIEIVSDIGKAKLTEEEFFEIYFVARFSEGLLMKANIGQDIL